MMGIAPPNFTCFKVKYLFIAEEVLKLCQYSVQQETSPESGAAFLKLVSKTAVENAKIAQKM